MLLKARTKMKYVQIVIISQSPLKKNNKLFQVIIQSDINSYEKVMSLGKLFVGYDYCNFFDAIELRRCFKCCRFHHLEKHFNSSVHIFPLCAQNHKFSECYKPSNKYCINCYNFNKTAENPIPVNHSILQYNECRVYKKTLNEFRSNILSPK
ncbi:unnamed protein product [Psylliodes chrysocephalus]|uniref:Uncharacterized protein n=1 Tax=Psylliodes chrysocephalus TaxID=3402493 RepID=A0A9P0CNY6_9CUCU|nr:unnamed protein product [Psylliodes chrysocephala]